MLKSAKFISFIASLFIFGFYFFSGFFEFLGITSSYPNYLFRFLVFTLSLIVISQFNFYKFELKLFLYFILIFLVYSLAMLKGEFFYGLNYSQPLTYSFLFLILVVLIPLVVFSKIKILSEFLFIRYSIFFIVMTLVFLMISYNKLLLSDFITSTRFHTEKVNAIVIGHLAVSLFYLSLIYYKKYKLNVMLFAFLAITSLVILFLTQSRGALVSFVLVFFFYLLKSGFLKNIKFIFTLFLFLFAIFLLFFASGMDTYFDAYLKIGSSNDLSAISRFSSYHGALCMIERYPLFGSGIEEPITKYYPHNILLELLMSVGFFGFILFLLPILISFFVIFNKPIDIFSIFYIQYFAASMFSGSVWNSYILWYMLFYILASTSRNNFTNIQKASNVN